MTDLPEELQERIAAYLDGELSSSDAARLEVYLANTDPALADMIVGMLADKSQLRAMPRPRVPADLSARVMESIERASLLHEVEDLVAPRRPRWQSRGAIAAALALVLGGFSYFVASSVFRPINPAGVAAGRPSDAAKQLAMSPAAETAKQVASADALKPSEGSITAPATLAMRSFASEPADARQAQGAGALLDKAPSGTGDLLAQNNATPKTTEEQRRIATGGPTLAEAGPALALAPQQQVTINEDLINKIISANSIPAPAVMPPVEVPPAQGAAPVGGRAAARGGGRGAAPGAGGGAGGGGGGAAGGFAGGRGGRGGAGAPQNVRGGGAAPENIAVAPQAPLQQAGAAAIPEDPIRILTALSRTGTGPLILTLAAKNDQDFNNLAVALSSFSAENARARNGIRQNGVVPQNIANNGQQLAAQNFGGGNNGQANPQFSGQNGNYSVNNAGNSITVNSKGAVLLNDVNNPSPSNITNIGQAGNQRDQYFNNNSNTDQTKYNFSVALQQAAARGGPYRTALTPAQLDEISKSYRIALIARGDEVHLFPSTGQKTPAAAEPTQRADLLRRADLDPNVNNDRNQQAGTITGGNAASYIDCVITLEAPAAAPVTVPATPVAPTAPAAPAAPPPANP